MQIKRYATPSKASKPFFDFKPQDAPRIYEQETNISSLVREAGAKNIKPISAINVKPDPHKLKEATQRIFKVPKVNYRVRMINHMRH